MSTNPNPSKLVVLKVEYKDNKGVSSFLFPLNPAEFTVEQSNRVGVTFTYGEKVFQNLGRGMKTITMSGHTGFKLDYSTYGLFSSETNAIESQTSDISGGPKASQISNLNDVTTGKNLFLDLYSLIQLIKGENVFIAGAPEDQITASYSIDNIDKIKTIKLIIPDKRIVYDVLLQKDTFMRSKDQPHLYKYGFNFVVTNESINFLKSGVTEQFSVRPEVRLNIMQQAVSDISSSINSVKEKAFGISGFSTAFNYCNNIIDSIGNSVKYFNAATSEVNRTLNDLRRLEKINDVIKNISTALSTARSSVQILKSYGNLSAFYETIINTKQAIKQGDLLLAQLQSNKEELTYKVNLQRLASISTPITIASNKATIAMVQTDIRFLNKTGFVIPIERVEEISTISGKKIAVIFSLAPSSLNIKDIKVFSLTDYSRANNLVSDFNDEQMILSKSFFESGSIFNIQIEYDFKTFEQINQIKYKSIRRVQIRNGDTFKDVVQRYAPVELSTIPSYEAEVSYLNKLEYPYIVTRSDDNYPIYQGSYANKYFSTNAEFLSYISNITITGTEGKPLPLYSYDDVKSSFLIDDPNLITDLLVSGTKFFTLLFKETYSNRLYVLFGIYTSAIGPYIYMFGADKYYLFAVEKGKSYEITENVIWEILSPYTINDDLIDFYGQRSFLETDPTILATTDLFTIDKLVINNIYKLYVGTFSENSLVFFTSADKVFLSGDADNKQYVILTNFINFPALTTFDVLAYKKFNIFTDGDFILLPSLSDKFLSFQNAIEGSDVYKIDLDLNFIMHEIIHARPDISVTAGEIELPLINGIPNAKQALYHRLITPKGGLRLHLDYGLPQLLGKKNNLENLILLKYNVFEQLTADPRVKSISNVSASSKNDILAAEASIILVNNDEITIH